MSYSKHFFNDKLPQAKPRIVCVEEDWEFLCSVFPEPGFRSYFCGHIISKLAKHLKDNGVHSYFERSGRPEFTDLPRFLSNIHFTNTGKTGQESESNDRRRVGGACEEVTFGAGESSNSEVLAIRETKEGEVWVVNADQTRSKVA